MVLLDWCCQSKMSSNCRLLCLEDDGDDDGDDDGGDDDDDNNYNNDNNNNKYKDCTRVSAAAGAAYVTVLVGLMQ